MIEFRGIPTLSGEKMKAINANYDGTFVYGNLISGNDRDFIIGKIADVSDEYILPEWWIEVDSKTVGQFTGLKDVNGKNIYEGDIVKNERNEAHRVSFRRYAGCFAIGDYYFKSVGAGKRLQVIGDIHRNADLFEEEDANNV